MRCWPPTIASCSTIRATPGSGRSPPSTTPASSTSWAERGATTNRRIRAPTTSSPTCSRCPGLLDGIGNFPEHSTIDSELGRWCFETTTPITEGTYGAARGAVDIAVTAADLVLGGERVVYGLCRPPGHHAPQGLYGGYCFFNNAAIAANHAASTTGSRVTVLDVDYHHGNGTQQIFYRRGDVQYVSLHGDPERAYPYVTGFADETGAGAGAGATLNLPMPVGADDDVFASALATACDAISSFRSDLLVVSLGVDTFHNDPISDLAVTAGGFDRQGDAVAQLGMPTVVVQEGGYDVAALGDNVRRFLTGLGSRTTNHAVV